MNKKIKLMHNGKELGVVRCIINKSVSDYYGEVYFHEFSFLSDLKNKSENGLINKAKINVIPIRCKNKDDFHKKIDEVTFATYNLLPEKIYE